MTYLRQNPTEIWQPVTHSIVSIYHAIQFCFLLNTAATHWARSWYVLNPDPNHTNSFVRSDCNFFATPMNPSFLFSCANQNKYGHSGSRCLTQRQIMHEFTWVRGAILCLHVIADVHYVFLDDLIYCCKKMITIIHSFWRTMWQSNATTEALTTVKQFGVRLDIILTICTRFHSKCSSHINSTQL